MKTITVITDQISNTTLSVLRTSGVAAVTVTENRSPRRDRAGNAHVRWFGNQERFTPVYRIDVAVDDSAADGVLDSIGVAYASGFFGDAEAWVDDAVRAA